MSPSLLFLLVPVLAAASDWRTWAGDPDGARYSPLKQINRSNVAKLRVAWTFRSADAGERGRTTIETTPLAIGRRMYVLSPQLKAIALDAVTGKEIWRFDPFADSQDQRSRGVSRGAAYWSNGKVGRVLFGAEKRLYSLDAETGKPDLAFGENGSIDLSKDLDRDAPGSYNSLTTPGVVYKDLIIVGGSVGEGPRPAAPGHIRAYHIQTGKRAWIFHTIPHPGEFGHETWEGDAWKTAGGANNWGGMSLDEKRGIVFASTGSPAFDFYGGQRLGNNVFGNSIIALDAATGKRIWHYQTVRHDLWDYDLPCLPNLVSVNLGGRKIDAVAQVTKTGQLFLLDRLTGKPLFPVEERAAPASDIPGEKTSPSQPVPLKPPAFSRQTFTEADVTDISPEARAYVLERLRNARTGGIYTPPSREGTVILPGFHGGALWGGASYDPATNRLYLNSNNVPWITTITDAPKGALYPFDHTGYKRFQDQNGYPAVKPPWGELNAIDLNKGEIVWKVPLGEYPELIAKGLPPTGSETIGGSIVTAGGLVFIGATRDEKFRAFDSSTGKILWETKLEAGGYAVPASYEVDGKQYVVIAAGGGGKLGTKSSDAFVAFALP